MAPAKSPVALEMDALETQLKPLLKQQGFRVRGRTFNRQTPDGLTQVVHLQMGPYDPPGSLELPGLRESLYGYFTVNLGVHVPEVSRIWDGAEPRTFVREVDCIIRTRLGEVGPECQDLWWQVEASSGTAGEIRQRLIRDGFPFLDRLSSRDMVLDELQGQSTYPYAPAPRIIRSIMLAARGNKAAALALLRAQIDSALEERLPAHAEYVRDKLAPRLGIDLSDS